MLKEIPQKIDRGCKGHEMFRSTEANELSGFDKCPEAAAAILAVFL